MTVREALSHGASVLKAAKVPEPLLEAEILLAHTLRKDRIWLHLHLDEVIDDPSPFFRLVHLRAAERTPIHYLTGLREFWSMEFKVDRHTLIPRPDTEVLVETALHILEKEQTPCPFILDLGTGSGCIALALLKELPEARVVGTDINPEALKTARENAERFGLQNRFLPLAADWLKSFILGKRPFDMVVSNPPYIAEMDAETLEPEVVRHEPRKALFAGHDGMFHIDRLLSEVPQVLKPGGWFLCEIGWNQGERARETAKRTGSYSRVEIFKDLSGRDRVIAVKTK